MRRSHRTFHQFVAVILLSLMLAPPASAWGIDDVFSKVERVPELLGDLHWGLVSSGNPSNLYNRVASIHGYVDDIPTLLFHSSIMHTQIPIILGQTAGLPGQIQDVSGQIQTVIDNTDGLRDLVDKVRSVREAMPEDVLDDVVGFLQDEQQGLPGLLDFATTQAQDAVQNSGSHPDLGDLLTGMQELNNALIGDAGGNVSFEVLTNLVGFLPDELLAVVGQALLFAGVDQDFTQSLGQTAQDVGLLKDVIASSAGSSAARSESAKELGEDVCQAIDDNYLLVRSAWVGVVGAGAVFKAVGKYLMAVADTPLTATIFPAVQLGVHGYVQEEVKNDWTMATGNMFDGTADLLASLATASDAVLGDCASRDKLRIDDEELEQHQMEVLDRANDNRDAVLANAAANRDALLTNDNANRDAVVANADANRDAVVGNDNANRDAVVANADANRDAVLTNDNVNRDAVLANADANRDAVVTNDNANRDAVVANAADNLDTLLTNADSTRDAILDNADTNTSAIVANDDDNTADIIANDNANKATIVSNTDANTANIIANDDANTDAIIANDNANTDLILELTQMLADDALRREIQNNLSADRCEPWMYTPEYLDTEQTTRLGGQLEVVVDVVQTIIDQGRLLGAVADRDLDQAQDDLDEVRSLEPSDAKEVCRLLLLAYDKANKL